MPWGHVAASLEIGLTATTSQQIVPLAAHLSNPDCRGAMVGPVLAGILCGIRLSQTISGFLDSHLGWRQMFWTSLTGLVIGVIVPDFAMQSARVSNQHLIFALLPEARSRINTPFMGAMVLGGAAESASTTLIWFYGWEALAAAGMLTGAAATVLQLKNWRRKG